MPGHNVSVHGVQSREVPNASVDGIAIEAEINKQMNFFFSIIMTSTTSMKTYFKKIDLPTIINP